MFSKYYQEELSFLRELGREFARAHPAAAHFLSETGTDPDVERLLEGFAFLTGRIREKLDDELPEITGTFIGLLWPHYLRPVPALTVVQFKPVPGMVQGVQRIPAGTEIDAVPVEGTSPRFRTCYDTDVYPFEIEDASLDAPPGQRERISVRFAMDPKTSLAETGVSRIRFFLHGDVNVSRTLYLYLARHVHRIEVRPRGGGPGFVLPPDALEPVGFREEDALLPYPIESFRGYRLLQEYFALPEKFLFFDLTGLDRGAEHDLTGGFEVVFVLDDPPESQIRVTGENLRLSATPAVNLFARDCDPVRIKHEVSRYRLRPASSDPDHYEVYSVDRVEGLVQGTAERRRYRPFYSFDHGLGTGHDAGRTVFYETHADQAVVGSGTDLYLSFVTGQEEATTPPVEIVSIELTCTNRNLPTQLRVGDVNVPTGSSPEFATFENILPVSPSSPPPLGGGLHWRLISHLALNHLSLDSVEGLRGLLELYNFRAFTDRQAARRGELILQGIKSIATEPEERFHRGTLVRGRRTTIDMDEENFACEGEMVFLGYVLDVFLGLYSSMNSFSHLRVNGIRHGEVYDWPPRAGHQIIL